MSENQGAAVPASFAEMNPSILMKPLLTVLLLVGALPAAELADPLEPFAEQIAAIQQAIAEADSLEGYYATEYREAETSYWAQIPAWMEEHSETMAHTVPILDVGCGYGTLLGLAVEIYDGEGACLDIAEYLPEALRELYSLAFYEANAELDPITGGPYDVIIMTEVIEHFNFHPLPTLQKLHDALAPGGRLFLSTPDAASWGRLRDFHDSLNDFPPPPQSNEPRPKTTDEHHWMYSKDEIVRVLQDSGFRVLEVEYSPGIRGRHFNIEAIRP